MLSKQSSLFCSYFLKLNKYLEKNVCYVCYKTPKDFYLKNINLSFIYIHDVSVHLNRSYSQTLSPEIIKHSVDSFLLENSDIFNSVNKEELSKVVTFVLSKGYTVSDIKQKCLPYLKGENLSLKFNLLSEIDNDILPLLPLLSLSTSLLKLVVKQCRSDKIYLKDFKNRISYLSYHLELPSNELIPSLSKHSSLLTMKFERLHLKMKILKNANIGTKYIFKDLWIFNYNEKLLASRIQAAVESGIELKPWILRCSKRFFESRLVRSSETHRILNGENEIVYLAKKLDCSEDYVKYMMERNKLLRTINIPKLDQVLNFLFEKGYTPQEIRLFPRVFCSSVQTLNRRFEEYKQFRDTLPTISQLCMASPKFKKLKEGKMSKRNVDSKIN